MGLTIDGEYFSKSLDVGAYVPPSFPTEKYLNNYDEIRWDKDDVVNECNDIEEVVNES